MLDGQTEEPLAIIRKRLERYPMENPTRMFLGELLRMQGDAPGAIHIPYENVRERAHELPLGRRIVAYCESGIRSSLMRRSDPAHSVVNRSSFFSRLPARTA